jgi:hypothetical protein
MPTMLHLKVLDRASGAEETMKVMVGKALAETHRRMKLAFESRSEPAVTMMAMTTDEGVQATLCGERLPKSEFGPRDWVKYPREKDHVWNWQAKNGSVEMAFDGAFVWFRFHDDDGMGETCAIEDAEFEKIAKEV